MRPRVTIEDIKKSKVANINKHLFEDPAPKEKKKSKYGNDKTIVDGIKFDSKREANRYKELILLRKAGVIGLLRLQVRYELNDGGAFSFVYVADFVYTEIKTGKEIVEDAKGAHTVVYKKKKKLMKKIYGIIIKET